MGFFPLTVKPYPPPERVLPEKVGFFFLAGWLVWSLESGVGSSKMLKFRRAISISWAWSLEEFRV